MDLTKPILYHAHRTPDHTALVYGEKTYSYQELNEEINRYSHGLIAQGIQKGDKVSLFLKNSDAFIIAAYSIWKAGGVVVPINFRLTQPELSYILQQSDSVAVIFDEEFTDVVKKAAQQLEASIALFNVGGKIEGATEWSLIQSQLKEEPSVSILPTDDAQILYTSGTTGRPKGALFSHSNITSLNMSVNVMTKMTEDDVYLLVAPAFHSAGLNMILTSTFFTGATLIVQRDFHPVEAQKAIQHHEVSIFFAVPAMYNAMLQVPKGSFNLSTIRMCNYGAAPMSPGLIQATMDYLGTDQFYNCCGLTEGGPGGVVLTPEEHKTKLGAAGKAMPFLNARVVNERMEDVVPGQVGEFIIRSSSVMKEYYKKPEETQKTFRDGWLLTGDLATVDEDGYITLVDRKKDMIISGGENVYSVEVEQVLNSHPQILEAAIIGLPDPKWGEIVTAIIVPKEGEQLLTDEVQAFCRQSLAGYKIPRHFIFTDALPRNASGKILKYHLREQWQRTNA
ncbi:class I adenylate-forming enzyme family protein [Lysinibacillus sp. 54212]|uniref:class I adenylate-forming enzyme family protein n=1 Tax=Lysinibacillus sp. 54212 TaxID=3119829 RepID=UPI002FC7AE83